MLLILYIIALILLSYSIDLPPVGQHDHSLTLIHLQALKLLKYSSHPPTLPYIVSVIYKLTGPNFRVVRLITVVFASLLPVSSWIIGRKYSKNTALISYLLSVTSPIYLIYAKAPLYSLFGMSVGSLALALHLSGRRNLSHAFASFSLCMDWTAIPLTLPVLLSLRRQLRYSVYYLLALPIYALWIFNLRESVTSELAQRLPSLYDILLVVPLSFLRLLIFLGPASVVGIFIAIRRNIIPKEITVYLIIQTVFLLLWADFYVHHTPYLFNFLPLLFTISSLGIQSLKVRQSIASATISLLYSIIITFILAYPYRLFVSSEAGCILNYLNRSKTPTEIILPQNRTPNSLKVLLTMVYLGEKSKVRLSYVGGKGKKIVLFGDTITIPQHLAQLNCETEDTLSIDRFIEKIFYELRSRDRCLSYGSGG